MLDIIMSFHLLLSLLKFYSGSKSGWDLNIPKEPHHHLFPLKHNCALLSFYNSSQFFQDRFFFWVIYIFPLL